ncbi:soluble guanylate cyclase 88E [Trichonephila clavipes]|nr:soluble guanylate cyclase 88E [Trichonephila clavipes]
MLLALRTKIAELNILVHSNNIFELSSVMPILGQGTTNGNHQILGVDDEAEDDDVSMEDRLLHLKGQMLYMEEWKSMAYLGTPLTAMAGSDVVQSGSPIFDDFFQHLWPYIGNNTANVVFQMVKRL